MSYFPGQSLDCVYCANMDCGFKNRTEKISVRIHDWDDCQGAFSAFTVCNRRELEIHHVI